MKKINLYLCTRFTTESFSKSGSGGDQAEEIEGDLEEIVPEKYLNYFWLERSDVLDLSSQKQNNFPGREKQNRAKVLLRKSNGG